MATEMITLKLEDDFLTEIDAVVRKEGYQSRTEFIRNAVRKQVEEIKLRQAMLALSHLKGAAKKKVTSAEYEGVRKMIFK